jgi:hypothetical protein
MTFKASIREIDNGFLVETTFLGEKYYYHESYDKTIVEPLIRMALDPSDTGCCPVCDHSVIYEESNLQRIVCESCAWEFGIGYGPLFELVEHIRKLRRARKRQEPASEQSKS